MLSSKSCDAFFAVAETGSFEQAAQRLCISASAVTLRVQNLEKQLGQMLLRRERPCRLTSAGEQLLQYLQQQRLAEMNLLQCLSGRTANNVFHQFSLASNADSLATWLLKALQPSLIAHQISLKIYLDDQTQTHKLLSSGQVNACISTEAMPMQGCEVHHLGQMRYRMVATAAFVARWLSNGIHRDALRQAPAIIFNAKDQLHHHTMLKHFGLSASHCPHYFIPDSNAFAEAIYLDLGFGLLPEYQIGDALTTGKLLEILPEASTDVTLYWHHWQQQSMRLQQLSKQLMQQAQQQMNPIHP